MIATLEAVRRVASTRPDAPALTGSTEQWSYAEVAAEVAEREELFRSSGGRVLALLCDNSPDWVLTDLAARAAGVIVVPIPQFFSPSQKLHVVNDCQADLVVATPAGARSLLPDLQPLSGHRASATAPPIWQRKVSRARCRVPSGTAKISYTSGTTGRPKGVCISGAAIDSVAASLVEATASLALARHLCVLPLPTLLESIAGNDAPLLAGAEVVVPSLKDIGWRGATAIDIACLSSVIASSRPNSVILVPEVLRALLGAVASGWVPPEELRFAAVGGGCVAPSLITQAWEAGLPVYEGYGLTECASVVALNTPDAYRRGSVGKPLPHARVRVAPDGQIHVAGPSVCSYLGEGSEAPFEFPTGDLGILDEDGFLYVSGRSRNVFINSYGRNVSPDWIEPEFLRHPAIHQIAVYGESRPWNVAVVVTDPGAAEGAVDAAIDATNSSLPDYARVGGWIRADTPFSLDNGQLTANGRVRRTAVREVYEERLESIYRSYERRSLAG